jgi:hypothetical protein
MSATSGTSLSIKTTNEYEYGFAYATCSSLQLAAVATLNQVQHVSVSCTTPQPFCQDS